MFSLLALVFLLEGAGRRAGCGGRFRKGSGRLVPEGRFRKVSEGWWGSGGRFWRVQRVPVRQLWQEQSCDCFEHWLVITLSTWAQPLHKKSGPCSQTSTWHKGSCICIFLYIHICMLLLLGIPPKLILLVPWVLDFFVGGWCFGCFIGRLIVFGWLFDQLVLWCLYVFDLFTRDGMSIFFRAAMPFAAKKSRSGIYSLWGIVLVDGIKFQVNPDIHYFHILWPTHLRFHFDLMSCNFVSFDNVGIIVHSCC